MSLQKIVLLSLFVLVGFSLNAQRYNLGIRAGLNQSKFLGPTETEISEGRSLNGGIHFAITFAYKLNEIAGFKTEIGYSAAGTKDSIVGDSYYIFDIGVENIEKSGYAKRFRDVSNAYINVPLHMYIYPFKKLEIFGGPYLGFLVNPTAGGNISFDDGSDDLKYSFIQSFDYNYFTDEARSGGGFGGQNITVIVDDRTILMPQIAGAYYQFVEKDGGLYNWFDFGLSGGMHFYVNRSFFIGANVNYGLLDITRSRMDVSFARTNNGQYIYRDDRDTNLSFQFSVGFKF